MNNEMIITPLGTVSTFCYENKCCPGFLIECGDRKIMLDCGNGISKYLDLPNDFNNLDIIISHLHSDHYGELLSLAQTSLVFKRLGYLNDKIKVYIPEGDKVEGREYYTDNDGWPRTYTVDKNLIDYDYLMKLEKDSYLEFIPYKSDKKIAYDELEISFSKNPHQLITHSIKLVSDNIKIVYSSDTGFKGNTLEKFAKDSNLLICESTFLRGQLKVEDYHLYASEAGKIAHNANVEKLLLTHFWPTIDKELYVNEAKEYFPNTEAAIEGKKLILRR